MDDSLQLMCHTESQHQSRKQELAPLSVRMMEMSAGRESVGRLSVPEPSPGCQRLVAGQTQAH